MEIFLRELKSKLFLINYTHAWMYIVLFWGNEVVLFDFDYWKQIDLFSLPRKALINTEGQRSLHCDRNQWLSVSDSMNGRPPEGHKHER